MRVLVCGSRHYGANNTIDAYEAVKRELLLALHKAHTENYSLVMTVIHGCAKGTDTLAGLAAQWLGWEVKEFPADWNKHGKSAGPIRNKQMLDEGKPDYVIAFRGPNSRGTQNMINQATKAGVPVKIIEIT